MTALYFEHLRGARPRLGQAARRAGAARDQVPARPARPRVPDRAARVRRPAELPEPRSRTPIPVDFSTGSVGIGATATIWSALAHRYVAGHFDVPQGGRQVALLGDAELDEGAIWEALVDPMVPQLGEVLWIVDLNRQSLDRVVPDIAAGRHRRRCSRRPAGRRSRSSTGACCASCSTRDGGEALRARIDAMPNEEYQRLLRAPGRRAARAAARRRPRPRATSRGSSPTSTTPSCARAIRDLGGHDLADLLDALRRGRRGRPTGRR